MQYVYRFCLLLVLALGFNGVLAQSGEPLFVRLATYWNAPGYVDFLSADNRYVIVYDEVADITRLVEVSTGQVQAEQAGDTACASALAANSSFCKVAAIC